MRLLKLRNVVFGVMLLAGVFAARTASADYPCNKCYGWLWTTEYCTPTEDGEAGRTQCVDPNAGWSNCSLNGNLCMVIVG